MSHLFLSTQPENTLDEQAVTAISQQITHYPWVKAAAHNQDGLTLIFSANKTDKMKIFKDQPSGLTFILQGEIVESMSGIAKIDETSQEYQLGHQVIQRYKTTGIEFCAGLNGMYTLMVWDSAKQQIEIATDRHGLIQLFYAPLGNGQFILTTDLCALKHVPNYSPQYDKKGVFDLLYLGVAFQQRTLLQGVERLVSNASYRIQNGKLQLVKRSFALFTKSRFDALLPKILDDLEFYYTQAVQRHIPENDRGVFFQSGGKDSRVYSHFLKKAQRAPHCVTIGENYHAEVFFSRDVSRTLGLSWERSSLQKDFHSLYTQHYLEIDNFSSRGIPPFLNDIINQKGIEWDYSTATFLGDPTFGSILHKVKLKNLDDPRIVFNNFLEYSRAGEFSESQLNELFPGEADGLIADFKKEAFELFLGMGHEPYQMLINFESQNNGRFKVGSVVRNVHAGIPIRLPCLDQDLQEFVHSLPLNLLYDRALLDIFLSQRVKKLAAIPLDTNQKESTALIRSIKKEIKFKGWYGYTNKIKLPLLQLFHSTLPTTQFYLSIFSMKDKGFQSYKNNVLPQLPALKNILNVSKAEAYLKQDPPAGMDHINPGNATRAMITLFSSARSLFK